VTPHGGAKKGVEDDEKNLLGISSIEFVALLLYTKRKDDKCIWNRDSYFCARYDSNVHNGKKCKPKIE
jgi:hypothetical protein